MEEICSILPPKENSLNLRKTEIIKALTSGNSKVKETIGRYPSLPFIWFGASTVISLLLVVAIASSFVHQPVAPQKKYSIFSSKPLVLGAAVERIMGGDSRAAVLDQVMAYYDCPLTGYGEVFVREADKNNIPYWLVASVSFQESNCGKKVPGKNGGPTYNAWGWGVWGDNVAQFSSWEEGIEVVSKYMSEKFYSKGVEDTCEIMKTYTPPSQGSWCKGVNYFRDVIVEFKT
jgi:hypothetical protein